MNPQKYILLVELDAEGQISKQEVMNVDQFGALVTQAVIAQIPKEPEEKINESQVAQYVGIGLSVLVLAYLVAVLLVAIKHQYKEFRNK
jgi:hypothetical protein